MKCRLKALREKRGLNQTGTAMALNVSQQTISRIESGSCRIPTDFAVHAAEFFQVPVDYFLGLTDEASYTPAISKSLYMAKRHDAFLYEYMELKDEYKLAVKELVHSLLEIQRSNVV